MFSLPDPDPEVRSVLGIYQYPSGDKESMRLRTSLLIEKEVDSDLIYANVQIEIWKSCGMD
jgi:hypothetical protein